MIASIPLEILANCRCQRWYIILKTVKGRMPNIFNRTENIVILTERTSSPKMRLLKVASVLASNSFLFSFLFFFSLQSRQMNWMTTGLEELSYMLCETGQVSAIFFFFWEKSILVKLLGERVYSNLSQTLVTNLDFSKNQ